MRRVFLLLIVVFLLVIVLPAESQDSPLSMYLVCWDRIEPGAAGNMHIGVRYTGEPSSWAGTGESWFIDLPNPLGAGNYPNAIYASVDAEFSESTIEVWTEEPYSYAVITFSMGSIAPNCSDLSDEANAHGPDGGWVEITIQSPSCDPCRWEIQDGYGHWQDAGAVTPVQDEGSGRFTRLVLGRDNSITDPARYRVTSDKANS